MKIVVYTAPRCPLSDRVREMLKTKGADFEERCVTNVNHDRELYNLGYPTTPQVFLDPPSRDTYVGGMHGILEFVALSEFVDTINPREGA